MKSSRKVLVQFILSFTLIMLVPFLILSPPMLSSVERAETKSIAQKYNSANEIVSFKLTELVNNFITLRNLMYKERCFYDFYLEADGGAFVYIDVIMKKLFTNASKYDAFFYSRSTDLFYGPNTLPKASYFSTTGIDDGTARLIEEGLTKNTPVWIPAYTASIDNYKGSFVTLIVPFETSYNDQNDVVSAVIFNIRENALRDMMAQLTIDEESAVVIMIAGRPVFSTNPALTDAVVGTDGGDGYTFSSIGGVKYMLTKTKPDANNIDVISLVPYKNVRNMVRKVFVLNFLIIFITFMLGCALIFFFTKYNYTPIKKLNNAITDYQISIPNDGNFFESISEAIQTAVYKNTVYEKDKKLLKLMYFNDYGTAEDEAEKICRELNMHFAYPHLICFLFEFYAFPKELAVRLDINVREMNARVGDDFDLYLFAQEEHKRILFFVSSAKKDYSVIDRLITDLITHIINPQSMPSSIGVGCFKESAALLSKSYIEAVHANSLCEENNRNLIFYNDVYRDTGMQLLMVNKEADVLLKAVGDMDTEKIVISFQSIADMMMELSDDKIRNVICLQIITGCAKACEGAGLHITEAAHGVKRLSWQDAQAPVSPTQIIWDVLKEVIAEIEIVKAEATKESEKPKNTKIIDIELILKDVKEHYLDEDFSMKALADQHGTTVSNLSHFFKRKTGENLSDYINTLKLNTVKKMLVETDYTISHISKYVGYYHTSNFIKKFKSLEGLTPNEYRNNKGRSVGES